MAGNTFNANTKLLKNNNCHKKKKATKCMQKAHSKVTAFSALVLKHLK